MKKFKEFILYSFILCLLIQSTFFSYTFADSDENKCSACNTTPTSMQMFINFEVELLWILQWASGQAGSFWTNKTSGLFAWWTFSLSKTFLESILQKAKKDLDSEIKATRAAGITAVLLSIMWAEAKDSLYSIEILWKDEAFVRDYKILQELDMSINDVIWDMWVLWIWDDRVSSSVRSEIQWLQYKYAQMYWNNNAIFEKLSISSDVKYSNLSMFLLRLNSFMKSALMSLGENTPLLDLSVSRFEKVESEWNIVAVINRDYIESIKMDYSCVSLKTCSKTIKEARKWLTNIDNYKESLARAKKTIKDANNNLKEAYLSNTEADDDKKEWVWGLTDRQVDLLYTVYGLDAHKLRSSQLETLKQNFEQMKKETEPVIDAVRTLVKWTRDLKKYNRAKGKWTEQEQDYINSISEQKRKELEDQIKWQERIPASERWQNLIEEMQNTINEILVEKWKDKEIVLVWVNQDAHYFVEIGWIIHSIVDNDIWDQNTEWLIKMLWEVCDYQCNNHGGKCYSK